MTYCELIAEVHLRYVEIQKYIDSINLVMENVTDVSGRITGGVQSGDD